MNALPEHTCRRLIKVLIRSLHLVGVAGVFGNAMMHTPESLYITLTIVSGLILTAMEASSGWVWLVQVRGLVLFLKLLLMFFMHLYPALAIPLLISVILLSGFSSHAPSWIRYYSLLHGKVIHSDSDIMG